MTLLSTVSKIPIYIVDVSKRVLHTTSTIYTRSPCFSRYWEAHRTRCKETAQRKRTQGELDLKRSQNIDEKMRLRAQRMKHEQWLLELKPKNQLGMTSPRDPRSVFVCVISCASFLFR